MMPEATVVSGGVASCESEPIHIPGSIQPHGVLLAVEPLTWLITHASQNAAAVLGRSAASLIGVSPALILGDDIARTINAAFSSGSSDTGYCRVAGSAGKQSMECSYSRYRSSYLIELTPDQEADSLDLIDMSLTLQAPLSRMERTTTIEELMQVAATEIRGINGFDRVMIYRFDEDWHGVVLAEDVGERLPVDYLGLHFPAGDIPPQARDLYLINTLRLIPDIEYVPVPICSQTTTPLDLSRSELRNVSPVHLQYLRNIGVRSTLTVSVVVRGRLWGLVACHHISPRYLKHAIRSTCSFFAQMLALKLTARIEHTELARRLEANEALAKFVADLDSTKSLFDALGRSWHHLLPIFAADALYVGTPDGSIVYGSTLTPGELEPALAVLQAQADGGIASSSALYRLSSDFRAFAGDVSGVLFIRMSADDCCIALLRREMRASVTWAGDPTKSTTVSAETGYLSPRASFAAWEQVTHGESDRWSAGDLVNAASLRDLLVHWQHAGDEIRVFAHYDALTELPSRRLVHELLKRAIADAAAQNGSVGLLFIDVDRFKRFNDRLGHSVGDRVLRSVASRISRAVRENDIVGRLGGDEFVVVMPAVADRNVAQSVAQRLLDEISQPLPGLEGHDLRVTVSIGISHYPLDGTTSEALLSSADAAMYFVKKNGRSAWESYETARAGASDAAERVSVVAQALERGEIVPHFQPIVDLISGQIVAFEALARWNHPINGVVGPAAFIEAAEESGLILGLGERILDLACRQVSQWRKTWAPLVRVAVNVSPRQLRDFGFVQMVRQTLERHALSADALELEITEGMMVGDGSQSITALRELADAGVRIAIDDFGTGYSSFNYLRRLPVKSLKIDQSFVAELSSDQTRESGAAIILAIVSVAKSLSLEVIAEGVETPEQLAMLRALGCDWAQGYLLSRPHTAAAFSTLLLDLPNVEKSQSERVLLSKTP